MAKYAPISIERAQEIEAHLDALVAGMLGVSEIPLRDKYLNEMSGRVNQFIKDCLAVGITFLEGFRVIKSGEITPQTVSTMVTGWTRSPEANLRSGRIVANMTAFELVAALDDQLPKLVQYGKKHSSTILSKWKTLGGSELVVRPSAKKASQWPSDLFKLLEVGEEALVVEALRDMTAARNCAAHELPLKDTNYWGEHLKIWAASTLWLAGSITRKIDDHVSVKP